VIEAIILIPSTIKREKELLQQMRSVAWAQIEVLMTLLPSTAGAPQVFDVGVAPARVVRVRFLRTRSAFLDVAPGEETDYRLRLRANTIGTSDPLKFLGLRSKNTVDCEELKAIMFDLDWNKQTNGSYLTASFYLCPSVSDNPREESDWLMFEYVGVPPGRNVRINILAKVDGVVYPLHMDWGPRDNNGRPLGYPLGLSSHRINIFFDKSRMRVVQDDEEIFPLSKHNLNFTAAYIYLQMSSGTNYPSREIYFDNIIVRSPSLD